MIEEQHSTGGLLPIAQQHEGGREIRINSVSSEEIEQLQHGKT